MKQFAAALPLAAALAACSPAQKAVGAEPAPAEAATVTAPSDRMMSPDAYVQGLYVSQPAWVTPEAVRALFEPALADALIKDRSNPDEVGSVNFSFWCGCQDGDPTGVTTTSRDIAGGHEVTARFTLFDKPKTIVYRLSSTDAGYRIADVSEPARGGEDGWSLRGVLGLKSL